MQRLLDKITNLTFDELSQLVRNITVVISSAQCQIVAISKREPSIKWIPNKAGQNPPQHTKRFIAPSFYNQVLTRDNDFSEPDIESLSALKSLLENTSANNAKCIGCGKSKDSDLFCLFVLLYRDEDMSADDLTPLLNALKPDILQSCNDFCEVRILSNLVRSSQGDTISQIERLTEFNQKLTDNINDALVVIDHKGQVISANRMVTSLLGYTEEELIGRNVSILMPSPYAKAHDHYLKHYLESRQAQIIGRPRELPARHKSGETVHIELTLTEVEHEQQTWFVGMMRDLTERKLHEARLLSMAYEDPITGLANLQAYHRDCNKWLSLAKSPNSYLYIAVIDIDRFSEVNLAYGREKGDHVMATMGQLWGNESLQSAGRNSQPIEG